MGHFQTFRAYESGGKGNVMLKFSLKTKVIKNVGYFQTLSAHKWGGATVTAC